MDRLAIGPHPFAPACAEQPVGLLRESVGFGAHLCRLGFEDAFHSARLAELAVESFPVDTGRGLGWCFGAIRHLD
jgi:hypothetical protein